MQQEKPSNVRISLARYSQAKMAPDIGARRLNLRGWSYRRSGVQFRIMAASDAISRVEWASCRKPK